MVGGSCAAVGLPHSAPARNVLGQKIEQHPIHFFRRLVLQPVAGGRQAEDLAVMTGLSV